MLVGVLPPMLGVLLKGVTRDEMLPERSYAVISFVGCTEKPLLPSRPR